MKLMIGMTLVTVLIGAGCQTPSRPPAVPAQAAQGLQQETFLYEVLRHVYRWHFDATYFLVPKQIDQLEIWTRLLDQDQDEGDRSEYAEIWIPLLKLLVALKRSDYTVPELQLEIRDDSFKVQTVRERPKPPVRKGRYTIQRFPIDQVLDYLFRTRNERLFADETLRANARRSVVAYLAQTDLGPFDEPQVLYYSPISPVCNETWVFWANQRILFQFSSDMDLANPAFWEHTPLNLDVFQLDQDVVVSPQEVPGSNAYVTKDWVGRVLFNCIILGQKTTIPVDEANRALNRP